MKGSSVAVTALPLCVDRRLRFAVSLASQKFGGPWAHNAFTLTNAARCLLQGLLCGVRLVWGVAQARAHTDSFFASSFPWPLVGRIYAVFSLIWAGARSTFEPTVDGRRRSAAQRHRTGHLLDAGMGALAGVFVAARGEVPVWPKCWAILPSSLESSRVTEWSQFSASLMSSPPTGLSGFVPNQQSRESDA